MSSFLRSALPWIKAARPIAYGMLALPLLWGQAIAFNTTGQFHWSWFAVIHGYAVVCQVFILYLNDYADEAVDRLNTTYWLSGGSRVIPDGQLNGQQLFRASFIALAVLSAIALVCASYGRPWMLLLTAAAVLAAQAYSLKPIQASYRGYGELLQGISCGVLLPVTAFYLQSGSFTGLPWISLLPIFLLFFAGNIVTALPDIPADSQGGKRTYPVRNGKGKARRDALWILALSYCLSLAIAGTSPATFALFAPAGLLLIIAGFATLPGTGKIRTQPSPKPYIVLISLSQIWVLVGWTALLFYSPPS